MLHKKTDELKHVQSYGAVNKHTVKCQVLNNNHDENASNFNYIQRKCPFIFKEILLFWTQFYALVHYDNPLISTQDLFYPNPWLTPEVAVTVYSAPDDGRKVRANHVEF